MKVISFMAFQLSYCTFFTAIYAVALGDQVDMGEIMQVAGRNGEPPDNYVFRISNDGDVIPIADRLSERLCQW